MGIAPVLLKVQLEVQEFFRVQGLELFTYEVGWVHVMGVGEWCVCDSPVTDPFWSLALNKKSQEMKNGLDLSKSSAGLTTPTARHLLLGGRKEHVCSEPDFWPEGGMCHSPQPLGAQ